MVTVDFDCMVKKKKKNKYIILCSTLERKLQKFGIT